MNARITAIVAVAAALVIGVLVGRTWSPGQGEDSAEDAGPEILYWVAPMDPNYRRDEPGKSPMGMDLVPVYAGDEAADSGVVSIDPTRHLAAQDRDGRLHRLR